MPKFYSLIPLPSWTSTLTKQERERHMKFSSIDHLVKLSANFKKWLTQILNNIKIPKTKYFLLLFSHNFPSTKMRKEPSNILLLSKRDEKKECGILWRSQFFYYKKWNAWDSHQFTKTKQILVQQNKIETILDS